MAGGQERTNECFQSTLITLSASLQTDWACTNTGITSVEIAKYSECI